MNEFFKPITSDKILSYGVYISAFLLFVNSMYIAFFYPSLPSVVPIFNQLPWGVDRLGGKIQIFLPTLLTFGIIGINIFFAKNFYEKLPLITRMLFITTALLSSLTLYFSFRIIQLVT